MTQPVDWRQLSGGGDTTPPRIEPQTRSEGDLNRNSYRKSRFPRLAARAVVNDDGTQVNDRVEALLTDLLAVCKRIEAVLQAKVQNAP